MSLNNYNLCIAAADTKRHMPVEQEIISHFRNDGKPHHFYMANIVSKVINALVESTLFHRVCFEIVTNHYTTKR